MATFEYAPAPESRAIVTLEKSYGLYIDGAFTRPKDTFESINPADETVLAEVSQAGRKDVDKAVAAARRAFEGPWGRISGAERGKYLFRIARILRERSREFAVLETLDNGKPIKETRDVDLPIAAAHFFYHAGWADKLSYAAGLGSPGTLTRPYGVVGQIIPWNFPLLMLAWKIAPALATGNTVASSRRRRRSLTALLFAEVCQQADLPPGSSTSSRATGARARPSSTTPTSTRSPSPAPPRWARPSRVGSPVPRRPRSSSAARPPASSSTTRRSTRRSRASSTASSSTRDRCAVRARAAGAGRASTTPSSPG